MIDDESIENTEIETGVIELIPGKIQGRESYIVLKIKLEKYEAFKEAQKNKNLSNLEQYGEVLFAGYGKTSQEEVLKKLSEKMTVITTQEELYDYYS